MWVLFKAMLCLWQSVGLAVLVSPVCLCVCVYTSVGYTAVLLAHPAKGKAAATSIGLGESVLRVHHDGLQWLESRNPGVPESGGGGSSFLRSFNTYPLQKLNKSGRRIVTKNSRT